MRGGGKRKTFFFAKYFLAAKLKTVSTIAVSIVFGVPTVRRQQTYLIQTLINLIGNMNQTEQKDSLIVVMIGEVIFFCFTCNNRIISLPDINIVGVYTIFKTDQQYIKQVTEEIKTR